MRHWLRNTQENIVFWKYLKEEEEKKKRNEERNIRLSRPPWLLLGSENCCTNEALEHAGKHNLLEVPERKKKQKKRRSILEVSSNGH